MSAKYVLEIREDRKGFHMEQTLHCEDATPGETLGVSTIRDFVTSVIEEFFAQNEDGGHSRPRRKGGAE